MDKKEAYQIVFDDLMNRDNLLRGFYNSKKGNNSFMYGIMHVMKAIAKGISEEAEIECENKFLAAMIACEEEDKKEDNKDG